MGKGDVPWIVRGIALTIRASRLFHRPLEAEVGAQLLADEDAFVSTARDWTAKYASG